MAKVKKFLASDLGLFSIGFAALLLLHLVTRETEYVWDAKTYMNLGLTFGIDEFALTNYDYVMRGYLFPLVNWFLYKLEAMGIGNISINLYFFHSVLFSFSLIVVVPKLFEKAFKIKLGAAVKCIFFLVCMFMFKGLLIYPLTDMFSFSFLCMALYLYFYVIDAGDKGTLLKLPASIGIGACLAVAYYARPIYLISIIAYFAVSICKIAYKRSMKDALYMILLPLLGGAAIAFPQLIINYYHLGVASPGIMTEEIYEGSLYLQQLKWGLETQRIDGNLDVSVFPFGGMNFYDGIGGRFASDLVISSYWDYIVFVLRHPFDVLFMYLRHVFSGMDITYPNIYVKNVYNARGMIQFLNYSLLFFGIKGVKSSVKKSTWNLDFVGALLIYMLPVILCVPTAIETRFFIGAQVLLFIMACHYCRHVNWKEDFFKNKTAVFHYITFLTVCFMFNGYLFGTIGIPMSR
ncbi:MAG: hypothetical protein NC123_05385 [Butyrivibrio sp.]|nr:hypothetical protein [Acetatifactor muris]MCM1558960.1 hypothetical protein [Butyrivibrio sp.]